MKILIAALAAGFTLAAAAQDAVKPKPAAPAAAAPASGPVAKVNGVAVPRSRMEYMVSQQVQRGAKDTPQMRNMVREELVNREVIVQEATRSGMMKKPELQAELDLARQQIIVNAYLRDWVSRNPISDADIQKEYERAKAQTGEKEYRARHILVESEAEAQGLIAELKKGAKFEDLAARSSKDTGSKERGGDLDWNVPGAFDKQFSDAMASLEKGKITETPVRTRFGFHVIRLDDVRQTQFPPLADVRGRIQQQLVQNKVEGLVKGLKGKAKIE
ncbi:MAG TPA: peptidylprolyl isomerase [Burkholderiales bacterium]|nr:peptidylprolyl isomerase [Burkholderiales bacterium]